MPHPTRLYLGLDCGGTKTAACVLAEDGEELGRGGGGPCNVATGEPAVVAASVRAAVTSVVEAAGLCADVRFRRVCAGVAGYGSRSSRDGFESLLREVVPARRYRIEPDYLAAYWGASGGEPGVLVSAGTGAVVFARNKRGETVRIDGRGFLLGDRGSAFSIGRLALANLLWRADAGEQMLDIDRRIMSEIRASDLDDIVQWAYRDFDPSRIAALGGAIAAWADAGDDQALAALDLPLSLLATSAAKAAITLNLRPEKTSFFLSGGLWDAGGTAARRIFGHWLLRFGRDLEGAPQRRRKALRKLHPRLEAPRRDPAAGAALLALDVSKSRCNKGFKIVHEDT